MRNLLGNIKLFSISITNQKIRLIIMIITLALFVIGAGAPEIHSGGGGA